jgi:hypothetical protein
VKISIILIALALGGCATMADMMCPMCKMVQESNAQSDYAKAHCEPPAQLMCGVIDTSFCYCQQPQNIRIVQ